MAFIDYSVKDIDKVVKLNGKVKNIKVSRLSAPGENYMSIVLQVDFEVEDKDGHSKIISTVAKRLPLNKPYEKDFNIHSHVMKNEIRWYLEILPVLKDFARENGVEFDFFPEVCGARYNLDPSKEEADNEAVLILKNLIPEGYKNEDRYKGFDLVTSKTALKHLAIFHALPIAMRTRNPELFQILKNYLDKCVPQRPKKDSADAKEQKKPPSTGTKTPDEVLLDKVWLESLGKIPDIAPHMLKVKPLYGNQAAKDIDESTKLFKDKWNTIAHNDFWLNNILVKNRDNTEPLLKILDFQMYKYGSFAKDVVFFLFTSVRNDDIKISMDDLLRFYYDEFVAALRKANLSFELSYEDYLEEVRSSAAETEIVHAIFFSTIVFGKKDADVDVLVDEFDALEHITKKIKNMTQLQKDKITIIVNEAVKRNWI